MYIIIDCGSTNTRLYLINQEIVSDKYEVAIGVNSTVSNGNNDQLKQGLTQAIEYLLKKNNLSLTDIDFAIASGMITSNLGLLEVPHLIAPVNINDFAQHTRKVAGYEVLPLDIPIIFIPGVKNDIGEASWDNIRKIDLMRGEETQAIGVISSMSLTLPATIIELGSTTKLIHINKDGAIAGSITSLSGQVYSAVKKETFINSSIVDTDSSVTNVYSTDILKRAYECVSCAGLLRSLLFTRFIQFSLSTTAAERKFYCECTIAADDMKLFDEAEEYGFSLTGDLIFIGAPERCKIYQEMLKETKKINNKIISITTPEEIAMLGIKGACYIAKNHIDEICI
ncbi:2-dehydro-3-deoxygalactonokinase [Yersinia intermedia]|uniref:2-dehydro-3-deoxygalactonokinase n=1 Tax=Yersinia intermedia TaxID=631 RepID=UPI0022FE0F0F|nr:2-dehydro-3-deoxygalactonokinase [Yersinia intermedia]MDA5483051.1 2-dehydro-3-deoxygalactonokinase [Yersinia intermedia]